MRKSYLMLSAALLAVTASSFSMQAQTEETTLLSFPDGLGTGIYKDDTSLAAGTEFTEGPVTLTMTSTTNEVVFYEDVRLFLRAGTHNFTLSAKDSKITEVTVTFAGSYSKAFSITSSAGQFTDATASSVLSYTLSVPDGVSDTLDFTIENGGNRGLTKIAVKYIANGGGSGTGDEKTTREATIDLCSDKWDKEYDPTTYTPLAPDTKFTDTPFSLIYNSSTNENVQYRTNGIFFKAGGDYTFTIEAGNKEITKAVITTSGEVINGMTSPVGTVSANGSKNIFTWTAPEGFSGNVSFTLCNVNEDYASNRFLQNIVVTYMVDPNAAQPAEISFNNAEAKASLISKTYPLGFNNPYDLEATFTSSDEAVAVVNGDVIELKGVGTATITATTEESKEFEAGEAVMTITVIDGALNIAQMRQIAPAEGDEVKVEFETVVAYYNNHYLYLLDLENGKLVGNATLVMTENTNTYRKDQFIPAGWTATNATLPGENETWTASTKPYNMQLLDFVQYATQSAISESDINRVIKLTNVSIYNDLSGTEEEFIAVLKNGSSCLFSNVISENNAELERGIYTVTGAVAKENGALIFRPISFMRTGDIAPIEGIEFSASFPSDGDYEGVISFIPETDLENAGIVAYLKSRNDEAPITINIPEGYDAMYYALSSVEISPLKAGLEPTEDWISEEEATDPEGFNLRKGNEINVPATNEQYNYVIYFGNQGMVNVNDQYRLSAKVVKDLNVSVEGIEEVIAAPAEYYTIQGVKVANPEKGLYIKIANGKASKVIIK